MLEANDAAAVRMLAGHTPWVLGLHVNIYSAPALAQYLALGATRWVPPVELSLQAVAQVNGGGASVQTEVFAFGRLPLALSARCFTARHHHLQKDACAFRCLEDPDGLTLRTREGQSFLALNGIQTQSGSVHCLLGQKQALVDAGVTRLRLSPTSQDFGEVVRQFDAVMNHGAPADEAITSLQALRLPGPLSNGFAQPRRAGMDWITSLSTPLCPCPPGCAAWWASCPCGRHPCWPRKRSTACGGPWWMVKPARPCPAAW